MANKILKNLLDLLPIISTIALTACNSGASPSNSNNNGESGNIYAYLTNNHEDVNGNYNVTQCIVTNGIIQPITCQNITPTGNGLLNGPTGITIANNMAYIADFNSNGYTYCNVNESGIESSSCLTTNFDSGIINTPFSVAVYNNILYLINSGPIDGGYGYTQCTIDSTGIVESNTCAGYVPAGDGALNNSPLALTINNNTAYITSTDGGSVSSYTECPINSSGIESTACITYTPTGNGILTAPGQMAFYNNIAIIPNYSSNSYTQCNVSGTHIESETCQTTDMSTGTGMLSNPFTAVISSGFIYFTDVPNNSITGCALNESGVDAGSCVTFGLPTLLNYSFGMAIN